MSTSDEPTGDRQAIEHSVVGRGRLNVLGAILIIVIAAGTYGAVALDVFMPAASDPALAAFTPSAALPDPSTRIPGVVVRQLRPGDHTGAASTIEYPIRPPSGGPHGDTLAACSGTAYAVPVTDADAVHALEHGAVWITYDSARTPVTTLRALTELVSSTPYTLMSPYPGLASPLSLQAWEHELQLDTPEDPRFEQFIQALRANPFVAPKPDGACAR